MGLYKLKLIILFFRYIIREIVNVGMHQRVNSLHCRKYLYLKSVILTSKSNFTTYPPHLRHNNNDNKNTIIELGLKLQK